ncbi:SrtB family sortase [Clostridia bacterium]|nr:SrtB family sortase [Clostridia bacterium]
MSNSSALALGSIGKKKNIKRRKFTYSDVLIDIFPYKKDKPGEAIRKCVFLVAITAFSLTLFYINEYFVDNKENKNFYGDIASGYGTIDDNRPNIPDYKPKEGDPNWKTPLLSLENGKFMYEKNNDYVGYIQIADTIINYPIVQRKTNDGNSYYLTHAFDGSSRKEGCVFLDYRESFDVESNNFRVEKNSDNLILYGHNMANNQMFGSLKNYKDNYNWYSEHPIIKIDSRYNHYKFKIFAVCIVDADQERGDVFNYNNTLNFSSSRKFYEYVNGCKRRSYVINDVDVKYGDQLLTLSTCNSMFNEARLIIVARLLRDGEDELSGTQNSTRNKNIMMPNIWYKYNAGKYNPADFVPYGDEFSD